MAGSPPEARATLQAPTRPSRSRCGRDRRSRDAATAPTESFPLSLRPVPPDAASGGRCRPRAGARRGRGGAGVGGGVHHGEEVFELFGGGEDFEVLQAVAGPAEERALELAEDLLGGFGAVLVDGVGPAPGDPGQEVRVVLDGGAGQGVFHPGRVSGSQSGRTRSRASVMMVADRDGTVPAARAAASSSCSGGSGSPVNPVRGSTVRARESRRWASAALICSRSRRKSPVLRYPSSPARTPPAPPPSAGQSRRSRSRRSRRRRRFPCGCGPRRRRRRFAGIRGSGRSPRRRRRSPPPQRSRAAPRPAPPSNSTPATGPEYCRVTERRRAHHRPADRPDERRELHRFP